MTSRPGFLYFASMYWDDPFATPQQIARRLATRSRVLYVEPSPAALHLRQPSRNRRWLRAGRLREVSPGLTVYSPPPMLPLKTRVPAFNRVSQAWVRPFVRRAMAASGVVAPVLFTYLPHLHASIGCYGERLACYYCIDDMGSLSRVIDADVVAGYEQRLLERADLVFTTSRGLQARLRRWHAEVDLVPNGSDPDLYAPAADRAYPVAEELAALRGPVLGFSGALDFRFDQGLMAEVLRRRPEWTLVVVGPVRTSTATLDACPNVRFVGQHPQASLPGWLRGFTVGLVPYVLGPMVRFIYPTKLNDYLGAGVPVITTPLPELEGWPAETVAQVSSADAFIAAVERLAPTRWDDREIRRRLAVARENSWENRAAAITARIDRALAEGDRCGS